MIRNTLRQRVYAVITILGLTVGITFSILIGVFVWCELQVNQNLKDVDQLFLVEVEQKADGSLPSFFIPAVTGQRAVEKYPQVFGNCYRFRDRGITVSKDDKHLRLQSMIGDSTLLDMFGLKVLFGNAEIALDRPDAIVVTEKIARQFFDRVDVIGEILTISTENEGRKPFEITAVIADPPKKNSVTDFMNMDAQVFISDANRASFNLGGIDDWGAFIITYLKLTPGTSIEDAERSLNKLLTDEAPQEVSEGRSLTLKPISDYYLVSNNSAALKLIIALTIVTAFILLLAIVNFVNITVARSFSRLREVGVRKVIGGRRKQVVFQFLSEAVLLAFVSSSLALFLYGILYKLFGNTLNITLPSLTSLSGPVWIGIAGGTLLIGIVAGAYPALFLSATRTTELLKGKFRSVKATVRFSRTLLVVQFVVAIFILTFSMIMSRQIVYFMESDPGYEKSRVMIVSSVPRLWNEEGFSKMDAARNEFLASPAIESVSLSWGAPNFNFSPYNAKVNRWGSKVEDGILAIVSATDENYSDVYGIRLTSGKFFTGEGGTRIPNHVVLNESAQKALALQTGDRMMMEFSDQEFTIAGVVKDFNFESFHKPVQPVVFVHVRDFQAFRYFSFRLAAGPLDQSVPQVERLWKKVFPNEPFVHHFTDERMAIVYQTELQLKKASVIGSVLIVVIIFTGVAGLVSLSLARRTREIGIRKVFGATTSNILLIVCREYITIMVVAFIIGMPLSLLSGSRWLDTFAYRVDIEWWIMALPVLFLSGTTLLMVAVQSIGTSVTNPVSSLRHE